MEVSKINKNYRIRSCKTGMYVHQLRGILFISWVQEKDIEYALIFSDWYNSKPEDWLKILSNMSTEQLELVPC